MNNNLQSDNKSLSKRYSDLYNDVIAITIKHARDILINNPELDEFIMAMGRYLFTNKYGKIVWDVVDTDFERFLDKWDDRMKISGEPMRFTATGEIITNW